MSQNKFLQTLQSVDRLVGEAARSSSIYQEINQTSNRQELSRAKIETMRKFNEFEEEIQADPDFYKSVDQIYEEQNNSIGEIHPHAFDQKYEQYWTGGQENSYWNTAGPDGTTGRSQKIFEEVAEKYLTDEETRQQYETWYMEQSEKIRHRLVERGYERKAERMVLDLQDTLNNKLMAMDDDKEAIGDAYDLLREAVQAEIITADQGDQYFEDFKTNKLFNTQREAVIDIMEKGGYDAARKFALKDNLDITEEGREMLLEFVDKQYKRWDKEVRRKVDQVEGEYIDAWARGELDVSDVVNDPRLQGGHSYANDIKMRWLKRLQAEKEAAQERKLDPNEISDPAAEERAQELFNSEFTSKEQFKTSIRELGGATDGKPGLSKEQVGHWLEKADNRDDIINPVYQSALDQIEEHYTSMIEEENDPSVVRTLRQKKIKKKEELRDMVEKDEYNELFKNNEAMIQKLKDNLMAERIQYYIDPYSGFGDFGDFRSRNSIFDTWNWNDFEKFQRSVQSGDLIGVEDSYSTAIESAKKGLQKVSKEVFDKQPEIIEDKGGNLRLFFKTEGAKEDDPYVREYHGRRGYVIQFRTNESTRDTELMVWQPDLGWTEPPVYIQDYLAPPDDKELKKRQMRQEAEERIEERSKNWSPMGRR